MCWIARGEFPYLGYVHHASDGPGFGCWCLRAACFGLRWPVILFDAWLRAVLAAVRDAAE